MLIPILMTIYIASQCKKDKKKDKIIFVSNERYINSEATDYIKNLKNIVH